MEKPLAQLTPARTEALKRVAAGTVKTVKPIKGPWHFKVDTFWQKPPQAPYVWLVNNGYIQEGGPSLRPVPVRLTTAGAAYLEGLAR